jgi:SAM-dependent methyltransferase
VLPRLPDESPQAYLTRVYEAYLAEHGDSALGVAWTRPELVSARYDAMLDIVRLDQGRLETTTTPDLLDVGCGAAHLYEHLLQRADLAVDYAGIDTSDRFLSLCRSKYPDIPFTRLDVLASPSPLPTATYVVANGVLTYKADLAHSEMWQYAQQFLERAYSMARRGLAFNVMTTHLDWERDDLFHVPFDTMAGFVRQTLSRHFVFRQDYGAYEYTVYVYRDPARPSGP